MMIAPQPLTDLQDEFRAWDAELLDVTVGPSALTFNAGGVCVEGQQFGVSEATWKKVLGKVGAPARYFKKRTPELRALALQEHLKEGAFGCKPSVIFRGNALATICSGELIDLSFSEVLGATLDACRERNEELFVARIFGAREE